MADIENEITVYIHSDYDSGNWKVEITDGENRKEFSGVEQSSAIDLVAATSALSYLYEYFKGRKAKIYTENENLKKGITKWLKKWLHNGWLTEKKTPVQNKEHWQNLYALYDSENMQWFLVKNEKAKVSAKIDFTAYTSGRCDFGKNGTWKVIVIDDDGEKTELLGSDENSSSKKMALVAAIQALTFVRDNGGKKAKIFVDDEYVKNGITGWMFGWKRNGWITKEGKSVLYKDLWQELDELNKTLSIIWCYGICPKDEKGKKAKGKKKKVKKINLASLDFDVKLSKNAPPFVITREWIEKHTNCCSPTKKQMQAIGESYPLKNGWLEKLIGKEISAEAKIKFEGYTKRV